MHKKTFLDYLTILLWLLIAGSFCYAMWMQDWSNVFVVCMTAVLSGVPYVLEKKYQVTIAKRLRFGIIAFLFSTLVLGEVNSFYTQFPWWDVVLHFVAGLGLTIIGFAILTSIYPHRHLAVKPYFTTIFAFSFTAMVTSLWEVFEFLADTLRVTQEPMQNGNADTMSDIIVALLASLIICVSGFRYIEKKEKDIVGDMIEQTN